MPERSFDAVLFDFHGTVAQVEDQVEWVVRAAAACGHDLDPADAAVLAKALVNAGRAGGPFPAALPEHLAGRWDLRDLSAEENRAVYTGLAATVDCGIPGLPEALYERLLITDGWRAYPDTVPVLSELRRRGVRVGIVSNIGFDLRPIVDGLGFGHLVDAYALSYELGVCKPDPEIFTAACAALGVHPDRALMVGDTPADAGAVAAGCRCLVLPVTDVDTVHGLEAVLDLTTDRR